jgi:peptide/nickel transport system substrate-binding protein
VPVWEHADFGIVPASYDDGWTAETDRPDFFGDVRVRQAIAMCMDRQAVVNQVLWGQSVVLDTYLAPLHPLFSLNATRYAHDVAAASVLLEEAGWVDADGDGVREYNGENERIPLGTPLAFNLWASDTPQRRAVSEILAQSLSQCGIKVELAYWKPEDLFARSAEGLLYGRQFDMAIWASDMETPCVNYLSQAIPNPENEWSGLNVTGYSNPEFDAACNVALQSIPGMSLYVANHQRVQDIFADDLPSVPLFLHTRLAATRPDFCNFLMDPTASSELWNLEKFDYGECAGE